MDKKIVIVGDLTANGREIEHLSDVINHCEETTLVVDTGVANNYSVTLIKEFKQRGEIAGVILFGYNAVLAAEIQPGDYPQLYIVNGTELSKMNTNNVMIYKLSDNNRTITEIDLNNAAFAMAGMVKGNYPGGIEQYEVRSGTSQFITSPVRQ